VEPPKERGRADRGCCGESKRKCQSGVAVGLLRERPPAAPRQDLRDVPPRTERGIYDSSPMLRKDKQPLYRWGSGILHDILLFVSIWIEASAH
jgi:hypothetical protein